MFWLVVVIIVIVVIVYNNNKKKKQQQSGQQPTRADSPRPASKAASSAAAKPGAGKTAPTKPGAPPKAGDKLDQAAFARAFAHMSGEDSKAGAGGSAKPEPVKTAPVKSEPVKTAPKAEPAKSSAPPKAGDKLDQAAFARAFAHMSGEDSKAGAPKAESGKAAPKAEPQAPSKPAEPPKPQASGSQGEDMYDKFVKHILGYYQKLWNKEDGTLYTELDSMPIHHFGVQVRADRLVESVWLEGDDIPLVNETEYAKLCAGDESARVIPLADPQADKLLGLIRDFLIYLGTVEPRGDYFYPLRPGQAPSGQGAPAGADTGAKADGGKVAQGFSQADKDAQLRAQIQAMLEKQKKDNPPKK